MELRDAFFNALYEAAKSDGRIVVLTADMWAQGLDQFKRDFPERTISVGIAEQNLVNVATGLALGGYRPFCVAIASFIVYRCYEQIKLYLSDMDLPITLVGIGPGLSYAWDGPSHHCLYDVQVLSVLPWMRILTPRTEEDASWSAQVASQGVHPTYVRLLKGDLPACYGNHKDPNSDVPLEVNGPWS